MLVGAEPRLLPQIARGSANQHVLEGLIECASTLLLASPSVIARRGAEAEMDYLASREEFMRALEAAVEGLLGGASAAVADAPFEDAMVDLMTAVQTRLGVSAGS